MDISRIGLIIFLAFLMSMRTVNSAKDGKQTTTGVDQKSNPIASLILNRNEDVNRSVEHTKDSLSRVKRQFYYNPYYRRRPYPVPIPILFGVGGFGGRGFGGRGVGGGGFGGRGVGGGGFGGRGGFGGGHGGRG